MTPRSKELQFIHQNGLCCWCLKPMKLIPVVGNWDAAASWEHIVPRALGGSNNRPKNLVLAHSRCNARRGIEIKEPHFKPFPRNWRGPKQEAA